MRQDMAGHPRGVAVAFSARFRDRLVPRSEVRPREVPLGDLPPSLAIHGRLAPPVVYYNTRAPRVCTAAPTDVRFACSAGPQETWQLPS